VLTTSHAYWTWRVARRRPGGWAAVAGAVAPDAPALALAAVALFRGLRGPAVLRWAYHRPGPARLHVAAHSALVPAAILLAGRGPAARALAAGWAGHLAADALTHADDAWPHLAPLSRRAFASPLSYWQREHGARAWSAAETAALALALAGGRGARRRLVALGALAAAAVPLLRPRAWSAHARAGAGAYSSPPTISRGSTHSFSRSTSSPWRSCSSSICSGGASGGKPSSG
jgi:hypothetical protein